MAKRTLTIGKVEPSILKQVIFKHLGISDSRVLLSPNIGEDATVIDFKDRALVVHSDPITGAVENIGWLAVNVCTNDIATRGIRPLWILTVILVPPDFKLTYLRKITSQIHKASKELGVAVVGGHSEVTSAINQPVIITTALGETVDKRFVRTSGAKEGDLIIMTKGAGIEGTAILANELYDFLRTKLDVQTIEKAKRLIKKTSVLKEALTAMKVAGEHVHAMHDATEGGVAAALQEMAWASNVGIVSYEDKISIYPETREICEALRINPLKTISSGSLIISAESKSAETIVEALRQKRIPASIIGEVQRRKEGTYIIRKNNTRLDLSKPVKEELWRAMKKAAR